MCDEACFLPLVAALSSWQVNLRIHCVPKSSSRVGCLLLLTIAMLPGPEAGERVLGRKPLASPWFLHVALGLSKAGQWPLPPCLSPGRLGETQAGSSCCAESRSVKTSGQLGLTQL